MNYQTIDVKGKKLYLDTDKKRIACKECGKLTTFAMDERGTFFAVDVLFKQHYIYHNRNCNRKEKSVLEKDIESEDRKQEYLNQL